MERIVFLPGVSGDGRFWQPIAERLPASDKIFVDYPGLGRVPASSAIGSYENLLDLVLSHVDRPTAIVAQSMGGVLAIRATLARRDHVRRLVLTATSGGIDLTRFGATDWRPEYQALYPDVARWVTEHRPADLSSHLSSIAAPTLLLWGDRDTVSPVAAGRLLETLLPDARLIVVPGGDHMFARDRADEVAPHIAAHLFR